MERNEEISESGPAERRLSGKAKAFIAVGIVLLILVSVILGGLIIINSLEPNMELNTAHIDIRKGICNVSAEMEVPSNVEMKEADLYLSYPNHTIDLELSSSSRAEGSFDEMEFRDLIQYDEVDIKGNVEVELYSIIDIERDMDDPVDISFIKDVLDSLEITNVSLIPRFPSFTEVELNFTVQMEKPVSVKIENTSALMRSGDQTPRKVEIINLDLGTDGKGTGSIEMLTMLFVQMSLWGRDITIDVWGIEASFRMPFSQFSG